MGREIDLSSDDLLSRHDGVLDLLRVVSKRVREADWCLVGGLMTYLVVREHSAEMGSRATPKVPNEQLHATFEGGAALNVDGSWKHGQIDMTRAQRAWLVENGWDL